MGGRERERKELGWESLQRDAMLSDLSQFGSTTLLRQREWMKNDRTLDTGGRDRAGRLTLRPLLVSPRRYLGVTLKATLVWSIVLLLFLALDVGLLIDVLIDAGALDWFK